jgi:hypothetical protein
MPDLANAVNMLAMQYDPTPFLTEWQMQQRAMNPALNPPQPPFKPPAEQGWYDTFMSAQGTTQQPQQQAPTPTPAFGPQQLAAISSLMPRQTQWPPAAAVAPRAPNQVQFSPIAVPPVQRTPMIPSFATMLGR